jgi:hypothetical protein
MTRYLGKNLDVKWIDGSGTITISGNQTAFDYTPSIALVDQTAGADTNKTYLTSVKDGKASLSALFHGGTVTGGTVTTSRLAEGTEGTLIWSPEGTASGKPKYTIPAISTGAAFSYPFDNKVEFKAEFQQNGARVEGSN